MMKLVPRVHLGRCSSICRNS